MSDTFTADVRGLRGSLSSADLDVIDARAASAGARIDAAADRAAGEITSQTRQALGYAQQAAQAPIAAEAAISAAATTFAALAGVDAYFATFAAAQAGLGDLPADAFAEVIADETRAGATTLYQKSGGALAFRRNLAISPSTFGADTLYVGAGDSIMYGRTAPNTKSIAQQLLLTDRASRLMSVVNDGVSGSSLDSTITGFPSSPNDMVRRYATQIYPNRPAATGASRAILHIIIGANDYPVFQNDNMATAWFAAWEAYCQQARADGFTVIGQTIMTRLPVDYSIEARTVIQNDYRVRINDLIRRSQAIDGFVDAAEIITDMRDQGLVLDGTHPSDGGNLLLARALASVIARLGLETPRTVYPVATLRPQLGADAITTLERASLVQTSELGGDPAAMRFTTPVAAAGTDDFTLSYWCKLPAKQNGFSIVLSLDGGTSGLLWDDGPKAGKIVAQPGGDWTTAYVAFPDLWNHVVLRRAAGKLSYFLNGRLVQTVTNGESFPALVRLLSGTIGAVARVRAYSRALTDAQVAADYARLSEYDAGEASYRLALDDGCHAAGYMVMDRSPAGCHLLLTTPSAHFIRSPGPRGTIRRTITGGGIFDWVPRGAMILNWHVNVTAAGSEAVDLGDQNGDGAFFHGVLDAGHRDLPLAGRLVLNSSQLFQNASGYTIEHIVTFDMLAG